jgi:hypothetical protein
MFEPIDRRALITSSAMVLGSLALDRLGSAWAQPPGRAAFTHRGYLGWITDLATEPDPRAAWPSMRLDERLLRDYRETFAMMKRLGFNEMSAWGSMFPIPGPWTFPVR